MLLLPIHHRPLINNEAARFFAQLVTARFTRWSMGCPSGHLPHLSAWRERAKARLCYCSNLHGPLTVDGKMGFAARMDFSAHRTSIGGEEEVVLAALLLIGVDCC
ncbi:hypothetical protein ACLOJK_039182 [Asimina triloba]